MATGTKQRIVEHLQRVTFATASELANLCSVSDAAMRQHLEQLETDGVVQREASAVVPGTRGRPATAWRLHDMAGSGFPDSFPNRHSDLALDLIDSIVEQLGHDALDRVLADRGDRQAAVYCEQIGTHHTLHERVELLAAAREAEGYKAEAIIDDDGSMLLVEHHCAIGDAARACPRLCDSELAVFRSVLGPEADIAREKHTLAGDGRCVYRITAAH